MDRTLEITLVTNDPKGCHIEGIFLPAPPNSTYDELQQKVAKEFHRLVNHPVDEV